MAYLWLERACLDPNIKDKLSACSSDYETRLFIRKKDIQPIRAKQSQNFAGIPPISAGRLAGYGFLGIFQPLPHE
jgi:hypothetical protein